MFGKVILLNDFTHTIWGISFVLFNIAICNFSFMNLMFAVVLAKGYYNVTKFIEIILCVARLW